MPVSYRLLVFDWDGTLIDSVGAIAACFHATLADLGLPPLADETVRGTIGLGMAEVFDALGFEGDEATQQRLLERYRHHWFGGYRDRPRLFPGAEGVLRNLAAAGYRLAVATGKSRRGLERDMSRTGLTGTFAATRTADDAFSKPHPQMLLDLLDELGVRPADALMVGDTTFDLEMAANAGTAALAVTSGSHPRSELEARSPLACLSGVAELEDWLLVRAGGKPAGIEEGT